MPGQPFLVEFDDSLWALDVGLSGGHQIGFVAHLPFDEEHELARGICGTDDALGVQPAVESPGTVVAVLALLLGIAGRARGGFPLLGRLAASGVSFLLVLLLPDFLEVEDEVLAVQVLFGLPCVVLVSVAFPLEQVLDLSVLGEPLVHYFLDGVLLFLLLHGGATITTHHEIFKIGRLMKLERSQKREDSSLTFDNK